MASVGKASTKFAMHMTGYAERQAYERATLLFSMFKPQMTDELVDGAALLNAVKPGPGGTTPLTPEMKEKVTEDMQNLEAQVQKADDAHFMEELVNLFKKYMKLYKQVGGKEGKHFGDPLLHKWIDHKGGNNTRVVCCVGSSGGPCFVRKCMKITFLRAESCCFQVPGMQLMKMMGVDMKNVTTNFIKTMVKRSNQVRQATGVEEQQAIKKKIKTMFQKALTNVACVMFDVFKNFGMLNAKVKGFVLK